MDGILSSNSPGFAPDNPARRTAPVRRRTGNTESLGLGLTRSSSYTVVNQDNS